MASKQSFQQIFSDSLWSVEVHYGMLFNLDPAGVEPQPNSCQRLPKVCTTGEPLLTSGSFRKTLFNENKCIFKKFVTMKNFMK